MKKYVLTPISIDDKSQALEMSQMLETPRRKRIFPATKRQELMDRIQDLEDGLHRVFANPNMSAREKLLRHTEYVQAYREAYNELNKTVFAPPFSSEYLGPLPRERRREETREEEINQYLSNLLTKAQEQEEEEEEEEEEKTANASRIMSMLSPRQRESIGSSHYDSPTGPFVTPPRPFNVARPIKQEETPKIYQSPPKPIPLRNVRHTSMAETRERRGSKPVDRLSYSRPGIQRSGHGAGKKMRFRFL